MAKKKHTVQINPSGSQPNLQRPLKASKSLAEEVRELRRALRSERIHKNAEKQMELFRKNKEPFSHSEDYRSVKLRGRLYQLNRREAQVIAILHRNYKAGGPFVHQELILTELNEGDYVDRRMKRVRDLFKNKDMYKALIKEGERKGLIGLNI